MMPSSRPPTRLRGFQTEIQGYVFDTTRQASRPALLHTAGCKRAQSVEVGGKTPTKISSLESCPSWGPAETLACYWGGQDFQCIPTGDGLGAGEDCGFLNDCAGGTMCADASMMPSCGGAGCCAPFCDLSAPGTSCDAVPGTSCSPFFEEAPPAHEDLGICIEP